MSSTKLVISPRTSPIFSNFISADVKERKISTCVISSSATPEFRQRKVTLRGWPLSAVKSAGFGGTSLVFA